MPRFKRKWTTPHRIIHPVKVRAARALFPEQSGHVEKLSMQFEDAAGVIYQFDLDVKEAGKMIEEAISAYHAIVPPLRTSRSGWGA